MWGILLSTDFIAVLPRGRKFIRLALLTNFVGSFGSRGFPLGGPFFPFFFSVGFSIRVWAALIEYDEVHLNCEWMERHRLINGRVFRGRNIFERFCSDNVYLFRFFE